MKLQYPGRRTVTMAKCAPINCHYVIADDGKECMTTSRLANVSLGCVNLPSPRG